jgi:hypothetical protein
MLTYEFTIIFFLIILIFIFIIIYIIDITEPLNYNNNESNNINSFNNNALIIVEPRKHELLKPVIDNFNNIMDKTWDLYIFHGSSNKEFANNAISDIKNRNIYLISLDTDNLNANEYNKLLKDKTFWNKVNAENILVFQTDSILCKNSNYKIEDLRKELQNIENLLAKNIKIN